MDKAVDNDEWNGEKNRHGIDIISIERSKENNLLKK